MNEPTLTKREYFAAMALQEILRSEVIMKPVLRNANEGYFDLDSKLAATAVSLADHLIEALKKDQSE
jgi:hypothetical protein